MRTCTTNLCTGTCDYRENVSIPYLEISRINSVIMEFFGSGLHLTLYLLANFFPRSVFALALVVRVQIVTLLVERHGEGAG